MLNWAPANQPARFIRGDELLATLVALARANPALLPGLLAVATAYDLDRQLRARLAAMGGGGRVIEGGDGHRLRD